jgi:hypothetical protein
MATVSLRYLRGGHPIRQHSHVFEPTAREGTLRNGSVFGVEKIVA